MTSAEPFLSGRVAVVTGGGRGIGAEIARALSRAGAKVAIGDVDAQAAEQTVAGLPGEALALRLDVTDRPGFTAFLDEVEHRLGPIHVLVNNAGIMPLAMAEDESDDLTLRQLEINLHAVIHGSREAIRRMRPRAAGAIVNMASTAGKTGVAGAATYAATKHGVVGYSESIRLELRGSGVDVLCVMPGVVRTELTAGVPDARGMPTVLPQDVADAVVEALRERQFDVFVPRRIGAVVRSGLLMPRRMREWVGRAFGVDRIMIEGMRAPERGDYEKRAAASAPALDEDEPSDG
jgi:NAD(P)-dependent dehydrogenase (short-subunit alcohol dehydrogenase family)